MSNDPAPPTVMEPPAGANGSTDTQTGHSVPVEPPDQVERDRIVRDLDTTMLVEAAAGTGKTTSMVGRMIALLREGKCRAETLAAVTFTRKAAAELRDRFQVELERAVRAADSAAGQRLSEALSHIEHCFIGTIHSFCAKLLRERPVEAQVDLSFVELDDEIDQQLRRDAWDEYVATLFANNDPILKELDYLGLPVNKLSDAFLSYVEYPDVQQWPAPTVELPDFRLAIQKLRSYAEHMAELSPTFPQLRGTDKLMDKYEQIARMVSQADLEQPVELMEILERFGSDGVTQKQWPGGQSQGKEEAERWKSFREEVAESLLRTWREKRYEVVQRVLHPAHQVYDRQREQMGGLNYQDLLMKATTLLKQPRIREYFRDRFTHLLVDEFQDTDPIQAEVILLLTADNPNETDWQRCRPVPGSLFVVGDPKQSIYRFRRADIVTYDQVKRIIAEHGAVVSLSANFRAIEPVIAWVNQTFDTVFPDLADTYSPAKRPLQLGRRAEHAGELAGILRLSIPIEHENNDAVVEYEADWVARFIRHAIDTKLNVPRTRKELDRGVTPAVSPGDFLIIARYKKHLAWYARKLDELGVPNQVAGGAGLSEIEELRLLHLCLAALVQPDNRVALVAALRSELFGIPDTSLYAFKRAGGHFAFRAGMPASLAPEHRLPLEDAFGRLIRYDGWLKRLPLPSAVERIVSALGLLARAAARPGGNVQAGSLAKALELLRAAPSELRSAAALVESLGRLLHEGVDSEGAPARTPDEVPVRIMNLHKAKGLEAPVVFLLDPTGDCTHPPALHIDRSGDRVQGYMAIYGPAQGYNRPLLAQPPGWDELSQEEEKFQNAENHRLLYVAATRAGACLVVTQRSGKYAYLNPWKFFEEHSGGCPFLADPGWQRPPSRSVVSATIGDLETARKEIDERWEGTARPTYAVRAAKKIAVSEEAVRFPLFFAAEPDEENLVGEHGTEWGTVIHLLLETAIRQPAADLRQLAYDKLGEEGLEAENREKLAELAVETVSKVRRSAIWQRAATSERRLVEVPFETLWPSDLGVPTVVRGVIDLIFHEPAGWVIVDYKTHHGATANQASLVDKYGPQILLYADIWQKLVGEPVAEVGLYFTQIDQYVVVPRR